MIRIVEFEPKYSRGVASLYEAMGEKFSAKLAKYWHNARKYVKVLLAVNVEERVVGKVTLDLAYRPYAEIVNLMVHPHYRGRGIGKSLLEECIRIAEAHGFHIQYLMTGVNNIIAHRLYSRYGFIPAILPGRLDRGHIWLFRFSKKTFVAEFLDSTPFATYKASRRRTVLANRKLYKAGWKSLLSSDHLYLYFEGQPGQPPTAGTMPRISGVEILQEGLGLKISIHEESIKIGRAEPSVFQLRVANIGEERLAVGKIVPLAPPGVEIGGIPARAVRLDPGGASTMKFTCRLTDKYEIPVLSFNTVTITLKLYVEKAFRNPILVSAGFEQSSEP